METNQLMADFEMDCIGSVLRELNEHMNSHTPETGLDFVGQDQLLLKLLKVMKSVTVPVDNFSISFVEPRHFFDGSAETENYFVIRHYINYALYREEAHPISELIKNDERELKKSKPKDDSISSEELEQLTYENSEV